MLLLTAFPERLHKISCPSRHDRLVKITYRLTGPTAQPNLYRAVDKDGFRIVERRVD